jgi:tyrosyl-tRNA synthetase
LFSSTTTNGEQETTLTTTTEQSSSSSEDSSIYSTEPEALENLQSQFLKTMRDRGFLFQCTNIKELDKKLSSDDRNNTSAYLGFDATADSLHVGSLLQIMILRHFQKSHHRPVVLLGGGTSKVGDPTGKDESRVLLSDSDIQRNIQGIQRVFETFLDFNNTDNAAIMVNNDDWLSSINYLNFLRDYGTHFTINRMLRFESVQQRLQREAPLTFLEFNYMILQSYDFVELHRRHGVVLQLGGSDQWGNMVSGVELGRKVCNGEQLFALTAPLITTSDGKKMGKTAGGAVWLNKEKLSEYDYWQFWRNTSDDDVVRFLKLFTELSLEEIEELAKLQGADINKAKVILADEATALLHGRECLKAIHETIDTMFKGGAQSSSTESLPRIYVTADELKKNDGEGGEGKRFLDLFVELSLASSKKDARRLINGGGARLEGEKITDENGALTLDDFIDGKTEVTLRAGKKRAGVVELKQ